MAGLLVEAGLTLLLLDRVLDPASVWEGHAAELVDPSGIRLDREGDVDDALDTQGGDVPQVDAVYVLGLPAALELDAVRVDADDGVIVARSLGDGLHM